MVVHQESGGTRVVWEMISYIFFTWMSKQVKLWPNFAFKSELDVKRVSYCGTMRTGNPGLFGHIAGVL